jgi:hypothetical protein
MLGVTFERLTNSHTAFAKFFGRNVIESAVAFDASELR